MAARCTRDGQEQVNGLLLSTPVETVPILVTYTAVQGSIMFYAPTQLSSPFEDGVSYGAGEVSGDGGGDDDFQHSRESNLEIGGESGATAQEQDRRRHPERNTEKDSGEDTVTVRLDKVFPGRQASSPLFLQSSARVAAALEEVESNGPRLRPMLTRWDLPGAGSTAAKETPVPGGDGGKAASSREEIDGSPVEVSSTIVMLILMPISILVQIVSPMNR